MRRFLLGCLVVFVLLVVKTHPVFSAALTCGDKCGPDNPDGNTDCSACCTGNPSCSSFCNLDPASASHTCAWSIGNACTAWCAPGACVDGFQGQFCCDGVVNSEPARPNDYQITACGGPTPPPSCPSGQIVCGNVTCNGPTEECTNDGCSPCGSSTSTCKAKLPNVPTIYHPDSCLTLIRNVSHTWAGNVVFSWKKRTDATWNDCNTTSAKAERNLRLKVWRDCGLPTEELYLDKDGLKFSSYSALFPLVPPSNYCWQMIAHNKIGSTKSAILNFSTNNCTPPEIIIPSGAWWQVKDSDIASNGDLTSQVPGGNYFGLPGPGGFPGVAAYATTGTANFGSGGVAAAPYNWLAQSNSTNPKVYSYDYFANQIPSDITATMNSIDTSDVSGSLTGNATHDTNNYYWYQYDGALNSDQPLTIPDVNIGTRKVILMVNNADLNVTGNINLTGGRGFFMVIVNGNINIDPSVGGAPNLEGLYFADGTFQDGTLNPSPDSQLWIRGSLVANGGVALQRDLGGAANSEPAEFFEYAPDQIMLFPKVFGTRRINWKEVAP